MPAIHLIHIHIRNRYSFFIQFSEIYLEPFLAEVDSLVSQIAPLTWNRFLNRWVCQIPLHPVRLLHGDSVRSGGVIKRRVEVELETGIKRERVGCHLNHMDLVIALEVDLAEVILVEEVVSHDEA